jgi:feruloyl esterase
LIDFKKIVSGLALNRGEWKKLARGLSRQNTPAGTVGTHLQEVHGFGPNPGNLRMLKFVPSQLAPDAALVVVLHGCTQTAAGYDLGAGWSTLAERYGFALLLPEQQRSNNPNGCFNWFQPGDTMRGGGEAFSIRQMVETMLIDTGIDPSRVFITGLSAGGAMASVMLACYPEVFAGGAIIAGLPYGAATNVQQAFESMYHCPTRSARAWGDLVRAASSHNAPWPRISIWHGSADKTVVPTNAIELLKQWTELHGLPLMPSSQAMVDGYPRQVWVNDAGGELIESYTITHMAHGTPLATGTTDNACGTAGPFLLEVGISSSYHIAKFFGLADVRLVAATDQVTITPKPHAAGESELRLQEGFDSGREKIAGAQPEAVDLSPPYADIGGVISKALQAAGLMKDPR